MFESHYQLQRKPLQHKGFRVFHLWTPMCRSPASAAPFPAGGSPAVVRPRERVHPAAARTASVCAPGPHSPGAPSPKPAQRQPTGAENTCRFLTSHVIHVKILSERRRGNVDKSHRQSCRFRQIDHTIFHEIDYNMYLGMCVLSHLRINPQDEVY